MTPTLYSKKFVKYTLLRKYLKQRLSAFVHFTLTFKVFRCDSTYGLQVFRKEGLKIPDHPSGEGQASGITEGKSLCISLLRKGGDKFEAGRTLRIDALYNSLRQSIYRYFAPKDSAKYFRRRATEVFRPKDSKGTNREMDSCLRWNNKTGRLYVSVATKSIS